MTAKKKNVLIVVVTGMLLLICFAAGVLLMPREEEPEAAKDPGAQPVAGLVEAGVFAAPAVAMLPVDVYRADMTSKPGEEWSERDIAATPTGSRPFLGRYGPDKSPALTLHQLPAHQLVRLSFDLFLLQSWNGSSPIWGPSLWELGLGDGRKLVHASFGNCGFFSDNNEQSFPDAYPAKPYDAWTLAAEHESLGTSQDWGGPTRTFDASSVYHMVLTFPHSEPDIVVQFHGGQNSRLQYGVTNVNVQTLATLKRFTAAEMDQLWSDLGNVDRGAAQLFFDARWNLISTGDAATDYIAEHVKTLKMPDSPMIFDPQGTVHPYPTEQAVIHRERARDVLEAIYTEKARALKRQIPTVLTQ